MKITSRAIDGITILDMDGRITLGDDLAAFRAWCAAYPVALPHSPAPPEAVAAFLADLATTGGNVKRAAKAISRFHRIAAIDDVDPVNDALVQAVLRYLKNLPRWKSPPIN